ncbi:dicer-2 isoform X1 [Tribolium castaneum]|uniref:Endoribonuclease Dicer-like Protein n=2 Tax=Tribolium castaneum TaxID=7070 RepID=D6WA66_TRICA|nr:Dicer-2 [Tribolium castaneum]XP_008201496.1 PREDICTED: dicer-2 isoform X1 [Tribolium castaneum]XP_015839513.1 PREDICTED: dicer-2 isoform X1 [Tribolium castaneum]EEZ99277.1 Endoribonuclease Dicer-like Protein [Tribolium castaneum]|eukprot:NP_001107840.1 Dicer-2 [Tribolium castaneum]
MDEEDELKPRNYQVNLMEIAIRENTIIYLPTGSGKTFIAIMVLKQLCAPILRPYSDGGKISVILVNSVALVDQHGKYVRDHATFSVGTYTGEMNVDFWSEAEWEQQFNKYQVVIMTSQIMVNLINNRFIDLGKVNLMIFDECHHGVEDQPMRQIMKHFHSCTDKPRVLGLTATLLNGNCKLSKVMDEIRSLEVTFHSKVATVEGLDVVVGYSTNPQELFKVCQPGALSLDAKQVLNNLRQLINDLEHINIKDEQNSVNLLQSETLKPLEPSDVLKSLRNLISDLMIHIEMLGAFGGHIACVAHMIQIERIKKHCQNHQLFIVLNYVMTIMGTTKLLLEETMAGYEPLEKIRKFSSDKVLKVFEILDEYKTKSDEELCCLVFTKRRFTAKVLHHIIDKASQVDPKFYHIKSNFVVGNKNNPYNDTRENLYITKKNREVLNSFVSKEINVLVSSNVLEEGVDIPKCTLVIKFDKSEDYRSYIQSKGRARHIKSLYYTIVETTDVAKYDKKYSAFKEIENLVNDLLIGKNSERDHPNLSEIRNMYNEDKLEPYYVNGPNSAQVNMTSAVALLCRYCSNLASDKYTTYAPEWYYEEDSSSAKLRVVIFLPVVCPLIDPIVGPYMHNKKDAKRAAALVACIKLHQCGELDNNLLPWKKQLDEADVSYLFTHWPQEKESDAGNKKKKRLHDKEIAPSVKSAIQPDRVLYLHTININPQYKRSDDLKNAVTIYDLYKTPLKFGLLSPKPLPDLCKFPLFDSNGTLEIEIRNNVREVEFAANEMKEMREFHFLVFNDLLEILKEFLIFDNTGMNSEMLLVVPVQDRCGDVCVDFRVIRDNKNLKNKLEPAATERINLNVTEETYLHKIVSPWYRSPPKMYVVTKVCPDKSALSRFPNHEYPNFVSYYSEKHSLSILDPSQPLLLVKGLSERLNAFKPRGAGGKRKKEKMYEELEEYLIPELVIKQEFPSCLWIQARFLPSILSRLAYLLKLQQLQVDIARGIGAKAEYLKDCPPLELNLHLLHYEPNDPQLTQESDKSTPLIDNCLALECPKNLRTIQYNKDFAAKMLEAEYYWKTIEEPKDIERNINVTVMDIEYYETFISHQPSKTGRLLKNDSPVKQQNVPAITYDCQFEAKQLQILDVQFDNQSPNLCQIYQALTAAEANDIVNLERLETLGDSFLKFVASLYIIFKFPTYNEGKSTTLKGKLVSNKNLYYLGVRKNLGGILKNSDLSPSDWVPPCFCIPQTISKAIGNKEYSVVSLFNCCISPEEQVSGNLNRKTLSDMTTEEIAPDEENSYGNMCNFLNKQYVGDKSIADSVEALLGAYFLSGGIQGGIKFMEWIGILPLSEQIQRLIETTQVDPVLNKKSTKTDVDFHMPQWREIEQRLGYTFTNRAFLLQALTHSSYSPNRITLSYERLEFLGDAVLDFLITCYIFEHCGHLEPGQVTDLRSSLVNNNTFASLVVRCGFHKFLLMMNSNLQGHIDKFADYLASKNYVIDDEVLILLEEDEMNIAEYVDVPKVLGDIFEALAGAIYLDSNKDLKTVWRVFYKIIWREIDLFSKNVPKNVIRRLYECHTVYPPQFSKALEVGNQKTMVSLDFMCEGRKKRVHGFGTNKILAKRAAAKIALRALKL